MPQRPHSADDKLQIKVDKDSITEAVVNKDSQNFVETNMPQSAIKKASCDDIAQLSQSMHGSHSNIPESYIIEAREAAIKKASREALANDADISRSRYGIHFIDTFTYSLMKKIVKIENIQYTIRSISW